MRPSTKAELHRLLPLLLVVGLAVPLGTALGVGIVVDQKHSAERANDFTADLAVVGFTATTTRGRSDTDNAKVQLKAIVVSNGCNVELVRQDREKDVVGTVAGRKIEAYTIHRVNVRSAVGNPATIYDNRDRMLTPSTLGHYLAIEGTAKFPCFDPTSDSNKSNDAKR